MRRLLALVLASLMLGGCVVALAPIGADAERSFDPSLVGTWKPADASETWRCKADGAGAYRVTYTDEKGRRAEFDAALFALGGDRWLDLAPRPLPETLNALYADHFVPAHTVARVLHTKPKLALAILDDDWLEKQLAAEPNALAHETVRGHVVITATTKDWQRFLQTHTKTDGAFRPTLELEKKS